MAEASGAYPLLPAMPQGETGARPIPLPATEDDVLAAWIELLIADGLVPGLILPPL
ncbi:hypothetical protein [Cryptosporangium sp. NPDC051539]|uniref:hypothetical protein n=1 Tax=Cryptosporangium sp. NPDC051539 TaxID=3363962 RepID=UPI00379CC95D